MNVTPVMIDACAKFLREIHGAGKNLTEWGNTPKSTKKKWVALAEGVLRVAASQDTAS